MSEFNVFEKVIHVKTGNVYMITGTPDMLRIEADNEPAYSYKKQGSNGVNQTIWIRSQKEMEDGRFVLEPPKE